MKQWKLLIIFIILFMISEVKAFRIARPSTFSLPWTQDQINQLNDSLESIWNLQNGEFNLDIVSTPKTGANNGDYWIVLTGSTAKLQFKANNHVYSITPDGF